MARARRVLTLFDRRTSRGSGSPSTPEPSASDPSRQGPAAGADDARRVHESTLEAMFAYQDELSRAVPAQRRGAGRR